MLEINKRQAKIGNHQMAWLAADPIFAITAAHSYSPHETLIFIYSAAEN